MRNLRSIWKCTTVLLIGSLIVFAGDESSGGGVEAQASQPSVVNPETVLVDAFEGWGTALAWGGVVVGGWPDEYRERIADLLFSPAEGLGLNVIRYNIGGGPNPTDRGCGVMRPGGDVPGFQPSPGVWDWDADANQRWFLDAAQARGANIFLAFSDSAPAWMTISGCTNGAEDGGNNLNPEHYGDFADYLARVLVQFRDEWGVTFDALSPMNEPNSNWWTKAGRQEGSAFDRASQVDLINAVAASLTAHGLDEIDLAISDTFSIDEAVGNWRYYPAETRAHIDILSTHAYRADPSAAVNLNEISVENQRRLWMTEFGAGPGPYDPQSIAPALELGFRIIQDMRFLRPSAWIMWDGLESDEENRAANVMWGLITASYLGESYFYTETKQYYGMGNFSKFVRPGAQIIDSDDPRTLAAYLPETGQVVLVTLNTLGTPHDVNFDLSRFPTIQDALAYRTSAAENLAQIEPITLTDNQLVATLPPQSITTFVLQVQASN